MMDILLRCNSHADGYCRKELSDEAVVTSCSHVFCRDCVQRSGFQETPRDRRKCPACGTGLPSADDAILVIFRPTEEYKSTVLSGLDPGTILECTLRAVQFWNYQMSTEIAWQQHLASAMTDKYSSLNIHANKIIDEANAEIGLSIEKEQANKKNEEMAYMYKDKTKRCQTLQQLYDALKKRVQDEQTRGAATASAEHTLQSMGAISRPEAFTGPTRTSYPDISTKKLCNERSFSTTDNYGVEQLHPHQRSGSAPRAQTSSEAAMMAPPMRPTGRDTISRLSTTSTPAHRMSLNRPTATRTFFQTSGHQPSAL